MVDFYSLILGFLIAAALIWLTYFLRDIIKKWKLSSLRKIQQPSKDESSRNRWEICYLEQVYLKAQSNHLAFPIFSLDEIVIPPRFFLSPKFSQIDSQLPWDNVVSSIPYIPGCPELATIYGSSFIDVKDILSSNADFILISFPGMGKSVALAYITSIIAKNSFIDSSAGRLIPIYLHVSEIPEKYNKKEPLSVIEEIISSGTFHTNNIYDYIKRVFLEERAFLIIDGMDELTPGDFANICSFITNVKALYPNTRFITTASPHYLGKLVSLNFIPLTLADWSADETHAFLKSWGTLWGNKINKSRVINAENVIDPLIVNAWLEKKIFTNPLSITLSLWAAYIGDVNNLDYLNTIQAYIVRSTLEKYLGLPIEELSRLVILSQKLEINVNQYRGMTNPPEFFIDLPNNNIGETNQSSISLPLLKSASDIPQEPNNGDNLKYGWIIKESFDQHYQFSHPIIPAFLAATSFSEVDIQKVLKQTQWLGRDLTLQFFTFINDTSLIIQNLCKPNPPLHFELFMIGRWLHDAPSSQQWVDRVIDNLFNIILDEREPYIIKCKAVTSLAKGTGNLQIDRKFINLQLSSSPSLQSIGSLGSGAIKDVQSINTLARLALEPNVRVRNSACLALAVVGSQESMEALSILLLQGNDFQKKSAAEALALNKKFGHATLRDASMFQGNLMVRRASIYGLSLIKEEWARRILSQLENEETEWIVKSTAQEAVQSQITISINKRETFTPASETPWIITFASKLGMGVVPSKSPVDILMIALAQGTLEEKIKSVHFLSNFPSNNVFKALYKALYSGEPELEENTFLALQEMAMSGIDLPNSDSLF